MVEREVCSLLKLSEQLSSYLFFSFLPKGTIKCFIGEIHNSAKSSHKISVLILNWMQVLLANEFLTGTCLTAPVSNFMEIKMLGYYYRSIPQKE